MVSVYRIGRSCKDGTMMLFAMETGLTKGWFTLAETTKEAITSSLLYSGHMKMPKLIVF